MEFEQEFSHKILILSYERNIKTQKIVKVNFLIEAKGAKNADGDYISGVHKAFQVDIPLDAPNTNMKESELSKEVFYYWIETYTEKEKMKEYIKEVYDMMYPETVICYPRFSY